DPGGNAVQPGPAVLIGERQAAVHLLDVGRRVEPVALLEDPVQPVCEHRRNRTLAAARDAHHHDDGNIPWWRSGVGLGFLASCLARATRRRPPITRRSCGCPLLTAFDHERATWR